MPVYKRRGGFGFSANDNLSPTLEASSDNHQGGSENIPVIAGTLSSTGSGLTRPGGQGSELSFVIPAYRPVNFGMYTEDNLASTLKAGERRDTIDLVAQQGVRRLTPVEAERLQGFPDNWTDGQSDTARYRQLGNAVAVPVIEWIGRRILEVDGAKR